MARRRPTDTHDDSRDVRELPQTTLTGTVVRVIAERGFGFIRVEDGREFFFHRSGTKDFDGLAQGSPVSFVPSAASAKGPRAEQVSRVG